MLVSDKCAANLYPLMALVGHCQCSSFSDPLAKTHLCLEGNIQGLSLHVSHHNMHQVSRNHVAIFIRGILHLISPSLLMDSCHIKFHSTHSMLPQRWLLATKVLIVCNVRLQSDSTFWASTSVTYTSREFGPLYLLLVWNSTHPCHSWVPFLFHNPYT
jgi:hypothetical protein